MGARGLAWGTAMAVAVAAAACTNETTEPGDTGPTTRTAGGSGSTGERDVPRETDDGSDGSGTDGGVPETQPDAGAPATLADATGDYAVDGSWDLSAPIGGDRTIGDVVAEVLVEEAVALSGVPSALEDEAAVALDGAVGDDVRDFVDARTPDELRPGSPLMEALGELTARVRYESTLALSDDGEAVSGTETFERIYVVHDGRVHEVPLAMIAPAAPDAVSVAASWEGTSDGATLSVEPHLVEIRYGLLVLWLSHEVLGADPALAESAFATAMCTVLVDELTGGSDDLVLDLVLTDVRIGRGALVDACESALDEAASRALGLFSYDTPIEVGGDVHVGDADGDGLADTLTSTEDHGGHLLVTARPLSPRIAATFTARAR